MNSYRGASPTGVGEGNVKGNVNVRGNVNVKGFTTEEHRGDTEVHRGTLELLEGECGKCAVLHAQKISLEGLSLCGGVCFNREAALVTPADTKLSFS
jgi:hypothetical protein